MTAPVAQRCYRHPYVETFVRCTRCGRPICPDCMVPASVGHQCPECVNEGKHLQRTVSVRSERPIATIGLVAACVVMFAITAGSTASGTLYRYGASFGPAVAAGDWWRLITPMFLHAGLAHIAFNMFALYIYGQGLERAYGTPIFIGIFLVTGFAGNAMSFYARPIEIGVGASGAVFGILGTWAVYFFRRRSNPQANQMLKGIIGIVVINLLFGAAIQGIDNWAHLGGLLGGAVVGVASEYLLPRREKLGAIIGMALVIVLGIGLVGVKIGSVPAFRLCEVGARRVLASCPG
jgi:membrane associated rhomboid family serine protease